MCHTHVERRTLPVSMLARPDARRTRCASARKAAYNRGRLSGDECFAPNGRSDTCAHQTHWSHAHTTRSAGYRPRTGLRYSARAAERRVRTRTITSTEALAIGRAVSTRQQPTVQWLGANALRASALSTSKKASEARPEASTLALHFTTCSAAMSAAMKRHARPERSAAASSRIVPEPGGRG